MLHIKFKFIKMKKKAIKDVSEEIFGLNIKKNVNKLYLLPFANKLTYTDTGFKMCLGNF